MGLAALLLSLALLAAHAWASEASWQVIGSRGDQTIMLCPSPQPFGDGTAEDWERYRELKEEYHCVGWVATFNIDVGRDSVASRQVVWSLNLPDYTDDRIYVVAGEWSTKELYYDENRFRTGLDPIYEEILPGERYEGPLSGHIMGGHINLVVEVQNRNWGAEDPALREKPLTVRFEYQGYVQPVQSLSLQVGDSEWEWWYQPLLLQVWILTIVTAVALLLAAYLWLCLSPRRGDGGKGGPQPQRVTGPPEGRHRDRERDR